MTSSFYTTESIAGFIRMMLRNEIGLAYGCQIITKHLPGVVGHSAIATFAKHRQVAEEYLNDDHLTHGEKAEIIEACENLIQGMNYYQLTIAALHATNIPHLLRSQRAIVLERIAAGAGSTNWYLCETFAALSKVAIRLSPGSKVSFYFDDRIKLCPYTNEIRGELAQMPASLGPLLGILAENGIDIDMLLDVAREELEEEDTRLRSASSVVYGEYPAADNDGVQAITVVLPDGDGVVRQHSY